VAGPLTVYYKTTICSLTTSNTTTTIDGQNRPLNDTDQVPPLANHPWAERQALPSRGIPYEDSFSSLYSNASAVFVQPISANLLGPPGNPDQGIKGNMQLSLLELALIDFDSDLQALSALESSLIRITGMSIGCLAEQYPFTDVPLEDIAAGWDPQPTTAVVRTPLLRARLNMSGLFVMLGFGASMVFFVFAVLLIGAPPAKGEILIGDPGLLFIIALLRGSSLPDLFNHEIHTQHALDQVELRQLGLAMEVKVSGQGRLDIAESGSSVDDEKVAVPSS